MFRFHFKNLRSAVVVVGAMALMLSTSASIRQRGFVAAFSYIDSTRTNSRAIPLTKKEICTTNNYSYSCKRQPSWQHRSGAALWMSTSSPASASTESTIIPRVKAVDAKEATDGSPVLIKGWVRTVRKQKTLAFVEVNDGSNMNGIQCVLSFDAIDEDTEKGRHMCMCVVQVKCDLMNDEYGTIWYSGIVRAAFSPPNRVI